MTRISNDQDSALAPDAGTLQSTIALAVSDAVNKLAARGQVPLTRRYLRTKAAAAFLTLDEGTLIAMRGQERGPRYRRPGGRVVYDVEDLIAFMESFPLVEPRT